MEFESITEMQDYILSINRPEDLAISIIAGQDTSGRNFTKGIGNIWTWDLFDNYTFVRGTYPNKDSSIEIYRRLSLPGFMIRILNISIAKLFEIVKALPSDASEWTVANEILKQVHSNG